MARDDRITVLHVVTHAAGSGGRRSIGGPERRALAALDHIDPNRLRMVVTYSPEGRLWESFEAAAARHPHVTLIPFAAPGRRDWRALGALKRIIEENGIDVVHAQGAHGTDWWAASAARLTGAACVITRAIALCDYDLPRRTERRFLWTERRAFRRIHAMIYESAHVRDLSIGCGEGDPDRSRVIMNGVDLRRFTPAPRAGTEPPTFGMVGQLLPVKDWDTFLDAAGRIFEAVPESRGLMVGDGPERDRLRAGIAARGWQDRIEMTGFRDDVATVLAQLDVFVLTSVREGSPVAIVEAMAAGRPVVATDVGGVHEIVRDSETGFLARPGDPAGIAQRVIRLLQDAELCRSFGARARAYAEQHLSIEAMVRAYQDIYEEAARGAAQRRRRQHTAALPA